jgi:hypothetical protein
MSEVAPAVAPAAPVVPPASPPAPAEGGQAPAQNTADQAPATAPEGEKPDTEQDPEKRGSRRFERRLNAAHRRAAEQQARADFLEKQYNELRATQQPVADPGAPKLEQFKDIEEYGRAVEKYAGEKAVKDYQSKQHGETQKQQQARLAEGWEAKADRGADKYDDFTDVVGEIKPTSPLFIALMESDNGDEVAYHRGKNLKEANKLASLPPLQQILEIGRLSAKLAAEPPKPKTPSRAPAPITPLTGAAPVASDVPSEQDDMKTWMRKRNKQVHGSRK